MLNTDHLHEWLLLLSRHNVCAYKGEQEAATSGQLRSGVWVFNTFFYAKLTEGGSEAVRKWHSKLNFNNTHTVVIPIHHPAGVGHWSVVIVKLRHNTITHHDSMGRTADDPKDPSVALILRTVQAWVEDLCARGKLNSTPAPRHWKLRNEVFQRQINGYDCGIFLLINVLRALC